MDLLHEQMKMLAGEVALCTSSLKRLSEQAASNSEDSHLRVRCFVHFFTQKSLNKFVDVNGWKFNGYNG